MAFPVCFLAADGSCRCLGSFWRPLKLSVETAAGSESRPAGGHAQSKGSRHTMEPAQPPTPPPTPPPPKTSRLAVASLAIGIGGLVTCFLAIPAGVSAIVLGLIARRKIRRSSGILAGSTMALAGVCVGCLGILIYGLIVSFFVMNDISDRAMCASNLCSIGLTCKEYAAKNTDGMLPPSLKSLTPDYYSNTTVFSCIRHDPFGQKIARDYVYFGGGYKASEIGADTILVADRFRHSGIETSLTILFGDGRIKNVEVVKGTSLRTLAAEHGWQIPGPK